MFIGPYEHHSNELPWRESIADVVTIPEDRDGHVDLDTLRTELVGDRPLRIGAFSAASNVTGILTDTRAIARVLHEHGALSFWDFAAAAPYIEIDMNPADDPFGYLDAVFLSPHKFVGGPEPQECLPPDESFSETQCRSWWAAEPSPTSTRSSTATSPTQRTARRRHTRIVESIRAGLVLQLKQAVGADVIRARETDFVRRAIESWAPTRTSRSWAISAPTGSPSSPSKSAGPVVAGCTTTSSSPCSTTCSASRRAEAARAGPYGHRLLDIDLDTSHEFEREILHGCEGIKPGWTRVNFNYFIGEDTFRYVVEAVHLIASYGHRLLPVLVRPADGAVAPSGVPTDPRRSARRHQLRRQR